MQNTLKGKRLHAHTR